MTLVPTRGLIVTAFVAARLVSLQFAVTYVARTTTLGDTGAYLAGFGLDEFSQDGGSLSTMIMFSVSSGLASMIGPFLTHLVFMAVCTLAFIYSANKIATSTRDFAMLLALMSLPSIGIWTSIASKETLGSSGMVLVALWVIRLLQGDRAWPTLPELLGLVVVYIFKQQYLAAILPLLVLIPIIRGLHGAPAVACALLFPTLSLLGLWFYSDEINDLSFEIPRHFDLEARSTRDNTWWQTEGDIFAKAPLGMFVALFGPYPSEAIRTPLSALAFIESMLVLGTGALLVFRSAMLRNKSIGAPRTIVIVMATSLALLLFAHYPFGVLNPGSAIRYRSNFLPALCLLFYFLYSNSMQSTFYWNRPRMSLAMAPS